MGISRRVLGHRTLAWIGVISYSMYLYRAILILPLVKRGVPTWGLGAATLFATLAVASASYYGIERPALRLRRLSRVRLGSRHGLPSRELPPAAGRPQTGNQIAAVSTQMVVDAPDAGIPEVRAKTYR